ncbi:MAG: CZB domain-containing protein [Magnetococcales bacterium]|nr:CZB domain-containing protein [Magnetococcales bacterium]
MTFHLDIAVARLAHLDLEMRLESMIKARDAIDPISLSLPAAELCELGVWLTQNLEQGVGQHDSRYQLVAVHERFHRKAERLMASLADSHTAFSSQRWDNDLEEIRRLSREIIFLLTSIELEYLNEQHRSDWLAHPLQGLLSRLFNDHRPHIVLSGEEDILDVSHARLVHLRWLESMFKAFRNRGRHLLLDSGESCALGLWIQQVGLPRHGDLEAMTALDLAHQRFHTQADATIRHLQKRRDLQAEESYGEVQVVSREILYLLSFIESKLLDSSSIRRTRSLVR